MLTGHLSPTSGEAYFGTTLPLIHSFLKEPLLVSKHSLDKCSGLCHDFTSVVRV